MSAANLALNLHVGPCHMGPSTAAGMPDVERLTRKLERKRTSLADLCQLYRASSKLPQICAALKSHDGPHAEILSTKCGLRAYTDVVHIFTLGVLHRSQACQIVGILWQSCCRQTWA